MPAASELLYYFLVIEYRSALVSSHSHTRQAELEHLSIGSTAQPASQLVHLLVSYPFYSAACHTMLSHRFQEQWCAT